MYGMQYEIVRFRCITNPTGAKYWKCSIVVLTSIPIILLAIAITADGMAVTNKVRLVESELSRDRTVLLESILRVSQTKCL